MDRDHRNFGAVGDESADAAQVGPSVRVDADEAVGVTSESATEIRELKRRCAELQGTIALSARR